MEAIQYNSGTNKLSLNKINIPDIIEKDDVIIQVAYAGICGTDLHILYDGFPCSQETFSLGHEFSGIVYKVGTNVTHVACGDRVAVDPQSWCSTCIDCTNGRYHCCSVGGLCSATGIFRDGGWAQFARVQARQVFKLPPAISLKQGALCEPMSCISWGWDRLGEVAVGKEIAILGAGIIGNLWSSLFHLKGHRRVTVVEPQEARRELNKRLECGYKCVGPEDVSKLMASGWRADVVVDCSGNGRAIEQGFDMLRAGGKLCIFGVASAQTKISISPYEIFRRELTIVGAMINPFSFPKAIGIIESMGTRYIDYNKLGIKEYKMQEREEALKTLKQGKIAKAVFVINPGLEK